jgi:hypothetical protein
MRTALCLALALSLVHAQESRSAPASRHSIADTGRAAVEKLIGVELPDPEADVLLRQGFEHRREMRYDEAIKCFE